MSRSALVGVIGGAAAAYVLRIIPNVVNETVMPQSAPYSRQYQGVGFIAVSGDGDGASTASVEIVVDGGVVDTATASTPFMSLWAFQKSAEVRVTGSGNGPTLKVSVITFKSMIGV